jgi:sterol desaturase/sphingolipid hydroxylase (fatty acid hydroxylase superfamily)
MRLLKALEGYLAGKDPLTLWLAAFVITGLVVGIVSGFFRARKIQPNGFRWRTFLQEIVFVVINIALSGFLLGGLNTLIRKAGLVSYNPAPTAWWVIALEYVVYFLGFDTWFYWFHRLMHKRPMYGLVHKLHHYSTSPNLLTTLSVNPLESLINGGFVPVFVAAMTLAALPVHNATMALVGPTNIIMGLYVHSGYEFLPRWWNKSWATKWFITAMFHDQHHKYFNFNYGGYTTIWDWICGTVRPKYESDFEDLKSRGSKPLSPVTAMEAHNSEG